MKSKSMQIVLQVVFAFTICLGLVGVSNTPVQAGICTWTGAVSAEWSTPGNWDCGHVPTSTDDVIIANVTRHVLITTTIDKVINNLTINSGGIIEATASLSSSGILRLTINGTAINNGTIKISGTIESAAIIFYGGAFSNNGLIDINAGLMGVYYYSSAGGTHNGTISGLYGSVAFYGYNEAVMTFTTSSLITIKYLSFINVPTVSVYGTINQYLSYSQFYLDHSQVDYYFTYPYKLGIVTLYNGSWMQMILPSAITGSVQVPLHATLTGSSSITGDLDNYGIVSPGTSTGTISISGTYTEYTTEEEKSLLEMELGGTEAGEFDQLQIAGAANFSGIIKVSLIDPFMPVLGDTFPIITYTSRTGTFSEVYLPDLGPGLEFELSYDADMVELTVVPDAVFLYIPLILR